VTLLSTSSLIPPHRIYIFVELDARQLSVIHHWAISTSTVLNEPERHTGFIMHPKVLKYTLTLQKLHLHQPAVGRSLQTETCTLERVHLGSLYTLL